MASIRSVLSTTYYVVPYLCMNVKPSVSQEKNGVVISRGLKVKNHTSRASAGQPVG